MANHSEYTSLHSYSTTFEELPEPNADIVEVAADPDADEERQLAQELNTVTAHDMDEAYNIYEAYDMDAEVNRVARIHPLSHYLHNLNSDFVIDKAAPVPHNDNYDYLGQLNRIAFFSMENDERFHARHQLTQLYTDPVWDFQHTITLSDYNSASGYGNSLVANVVISSYHYSDHHITIDDDGEINISAIKYSHHVPVIVDGNVVAMLYRDVRSSRRWILGMYAHDGVVSYNGDAGYYESIPIYDWPTDILLKMFRQVGHIIRYYITQALDSYDSDDAKLKFMQHFHGDDIDLLARYFNVHTEYNLVSMRIDQMETQSASDEQNLRSIQNDAMTVAMRLQSYRTDLRALRVLAEGEELLTQASTINSHIDYWYEMKGIFHFFTKDIMLRPLYISGSMEDYIDDSGAVDIGSYHIKIDLSHQSDADVAIRMFSMRGGVNGLEERMQHPHIFPSGNACFGTYMNSVIDTLADLDIVTLLDVLVMFLSSCDPDDTAGKYWVRWVDEEFSTDMHD